MSKICNKCKKENSSNSVYCNYCGEELNSKEEITATKEKRKKKKIIVAFTIVLLLVIASISTIIYIQTHPENGVPIEKVTYEELKGENTTNKSLYIQEATVIRIYSDMDFNKIGACLIIDNNIYRIIIKDSDETSECEIKDINLRMITGNDKIKITNAVIEKNDTSKYPILRIKKENIERTGASDTENISDFSAKVSEIDLDIKNYSKEYLNNQKKRVTVHKSDSGGNYCFIANGSDFDLEYALVEVCEKDVNGNIIQQKSLESNDVIKVGEVGKIDFIFKKSKKNSEIYLEIKDVNFKK